MRLPLGKGDCFSVLKLLLLAVVFRAFKGRCKWIRNQREFKISMKSENDIRDPFIFLVSKPFESNTHAQSHRVEILHAGVQCVESGQKATAMTAGLILL